MGRVDWLGILKFFSLAPLHFSFLGRGRVVASVYGSTSKRGCLWYSGSRTTPVASVSKSAWSNFWRGSGFHSYDRRAAGRDTARLERGILSPLIRGGSPPEPPLFLKQLRVDSQELRACGQALLPDGQSNFRFEISDLKRQSKAQRAAVRNGMSVED